MYSNILTVSEFQYILCCGSTFMEENESLEQIHFNTSYVAVQRFCHAQAWLGDSISIHLMLRFNKN